MKNIKELKINTEKLLKNAGLEFKNINDVVLYMQNIVDELERHNKNYTKKQYILITLLKNVLESFEIQ